MKIQKYVVTKEVLESVQLFVQLHANDDLFGKFIMFRGEFVNKFSPLNNLSLEDFTLIVANHYEVADEEVEHIKEGHWYQSNGTDDYVFITKVDAGTISYQYADWEEDSCRFRGEESFMELFSLVEPGSIIDSLLRVGREVPKIVIGDVVVNGETVVLIDNEAKVKAFNILLESHTEHMEYIYPVESRMEAK